MTRSRTTHETWLTACDSANEGVRQVIRTTGGSPLQPLDRLTALDLLAKAVAQGKRDAARGARGEGMSWETLAPLLGLAMDPRRSPAEVAFEFVTPPRADFPHDECTTYFQCGTCGGYVTDRGPYNPHPSDQERGHAEGCVRHNAEIAAYRKQLNED